MGGMSLGSSREMRSAMRSSSERVVLQNGYVLYGAWHARVSYVTVFTGTVELAARRADKAARRGTKRNPAM